jgi:hypothetical protein
MKIKIKEKIEVEKEIDIEFPFYRSLSGDSYKVLTKVISPDKSISIHENFDEESFEIEFKDCGINGYSDNIDETLGRAFGYECTKEEFEALLNKLKDKINSIEV